MGSISAGVKARMQNVTAILSMLHEPAGRNSATRLFRKVPVLRWTLDRLGRCAGVDKTVVICWEDQLDGVIPPAGEERAFVLAKGPRIWLPEMEAISAARRWSDGWRGGLLSTCDFDRGFYGPWVQEAAAELSAEAVVLIDPSAGLVDPALVDGLIAHAKARPDVELCFCPAAPGLAGVLLRAPLLGRLAAAKAHPGRLMHYLPDQISREPLAGEGCAPVPAAVARTVSRFTLDSDRQTARMEEATLSLNGQLISAGAEELVRRTNAARGDDALPREVVLELTTRRNSRPVFWAGRYESIERPDLSLEAARRLIAELAQRDDVRLTLAGVGDPLLSDALFEVIELAAAHEIRAVHVETDLAGVPAERVARLARSAADVVSVHLPGVTPQTYEQVMGGRAGGYTAVLENIRRFVTERLAARGRVPIVAPTFVKCRQNLAEMEAWYDQWLRAVGCAVVRAPAGCGGSGTVPAEVAVADMSPPRRRGCVRLASRLVVLSDGRVVPCEEDVIGRQVLGDLTKEPIGDTWRGASVRLRQDHAAGRWEAHPVCVGCREWHRP